MQQQQDITIIMLTEHSPRALSFIAQQQNGYDNFLL